MIQASLMPSHLYAATQQNRSQLLTYFSSSHALNKLEQRFQVSCFALQWRTVSFGWRCIINYHFLDVSIKFLSVDK